MAIARGAGTEIIRSAHFKDIANTNADLIIGVQHHIYTVLSVIIHFRTIGGSATADAGATILFVGYDTFGGTSAQNITVANTQGRSALDTFVWNDKWCFNGTEPTDFTATLDATKQDAIADQATTTAQKLQVYTGHSSTTVDVTVSFIDQNNA